jgi:hypothetical protein
MDCPSNDSKRGVANEPAEPISDKMNQDSKTLIQFRENEAICVFVGLFCPKCLNVHRTEPILRKLSSF